jgi:hypothetical protein
MTTGIEDEHRGGPGRRSGEVHMARRWRIVMGAVVVLLAVVVVLPSVSRRRESAQPLDDSRCLRQLHMLAMAMRMYAMDSGGCLPDKERWVECLVPLYIDRDETLKCPRDQSNGRCSYGMNEALSRAAIDSLKDPRAAVVLYETQHPGANPFGGPDDVASPPRHGRVNYYVYIDGSARAFEEAPEIGGR